MEQFMDRFLSIDPPYSLIIFPHSCNKKTTYQIYNVGRGEKIDLLTLATYIQKMKKRSSKIIVKKNGLNNEFTCNNKRLLEELKDLTFTRFEDAIDSLYSYYQQILPTIQKKTIEEY